MLNKSRSDVKRSIPLVGLPILINGLLNIIEKAVPWKESVKIKSALSNSSNQLSTGGAIRSV